WVFRPGYPLISVNLTNDRQLVLAQQRFSYTANSSTETAGQRWHVPIQIRITTRGRSETHRLLLTDAELRLPLGDRPDAVVVNEGGHGFYRVRYSPNLLEQLLRLLPDGLAAIERFNLVNDAWASVLGGLMPLVDYLDMTARFRGERDTNVW